MIGCFSLSFMRVNEEYSGFGQLVRQKMRFEDITLGLGIMQGEFLSLCTSDSHGRKEFCFQVVRLSVTFM